MNTHNQEKKENYIKKLISNSRAIISHQIAIPLGSQKMEKILYWIEHIEPLNEMDASIFSQYNGAIRSLPIGIERLSYSKDYLLSEDLKLDEITSMYKNKIIEKCFEIIKQYEVEKS